MAATALKQWNQLVMELKKVGKGVNEDKKLKQQTVDISFVLRQRDDELTEFAQSKTVLETKEKGLHRMSRAVEAEIDLVRKKMQKTQKQLDEKNKKSNAEYIKRCNEEEKRHQEALKKNPSAKKKDITPRTPVEINVGTEARKLSKLIKLIEAYRGKLKLNGAEDAVVKEHKKWQTVVINPAIQMHGILIPEIVLKNNAVEKYFTKLGEMSDDANKLSKEWKEHDRNLKTLGVDFLDKGGKLKTNLAAWAKKKKTDQHRKMQTKIVTDVVNDIVKKISKMIP